MLMKRMELSNIRSYVHEEIEFDRGLNFLQGDIGAGKSTILMAMKFALFGKSKGLDYTQILREGAREGLVRLTFLANGKEYTITRRLKRKVGRKRGEVVEGIEQEKVVIEDEETRRELSPTEADEILLKLISAGKRVGKGAFSKMYEFALYVPQEQMKEILGRLKEEKEAKKKTISQLFGCEIYGIARENANEVRRMLEREVELVMARLGENFVEIERRERTLSEEREELERMESEVRRGEEEIQGLSIEVDRAGATLAQLRKLRKEKEVLERKRSALGARKELVRQEIERSRNEIEELAKKIEGIKEEVEELKPYHDSYLQVARVVEEEKGKKEKVARIEVQIREKDGKVGELEEQIAALEKALSCAQELEERLSGFGNLEMEIERIEMERRECTERKSELRTEIGRLKEDIGEAEKERGELTGLAGMQVCPKCKQPLTKYHIERLVNEFERKVEEKNNLIREKEREIKKMEARQVFLEAQVKEKRKLMLEREKVRQMLEEIEKKKKELAEKRKKLEVLRTEIGKLRKELESIGFDPEVFAANERKLSELAEYEEKWKRLSTVLAEEERHLVDLRKKKEEKERAFKELSDELCVVEKTLGEIAYDEEAHTKMEEKHKEMFGMLQAKRSEVAERKKQIEERRRRIAEIEKELEELLGLRGRMEKLKRWVVWFEKLGKCYEEIERNVLREARYMLEAELQRFFRELLENSEMEVTLDENFTPEVSVGEGYIRPFENLSGGEGTALSLAYRLALNKVLTRTFFGDNALLILDEPTDGFSSEQINSLRELLGRIKESYGNGQIFVVSHEQELEGAADTVYEVLQTGTGTRVRKRGVNAEG
ncbi:MAG: SMC family ATPase [Thermoplasmata archaeon]